MKKLLFVTMMVANGVSATAQTDSISGNLHLDEVTVAGVRRLAKATGTGLVYDMRHDKAARTMNLLEALRRVPLVTVEANGEIKVQGSGRYSIYLNGRPYRIAQSSPKETLSAIPASTIESIEVITLLDGRYDAETGDAVINIITAKNSLDGYSLSLNGGAATQPTADAGATLMANKGKVSLSAGYNYNLNVQRNQPSHVDYEFFAPDGSTAKTAHTDWNGTGRWTDHLARLMMEWTPDSLSSVYLDGHALINGVNSRGDGKIFHSGVASHSRSSYSNDKWQGTAESNLIYRNYYPGGNNQDRFTLGYRFTYNPDKRQYDNDYCPDDSQNSNPSTQNSLQQNRTNTDGHLLEHTFSADYALPLSQGHTLRLGAKQVLRNGDVESEYLRWSGDAWLPMSYEGFGYAGGIRYTQNVSSLYASYSGRVRKALLNASLRGEYNHNSILLTETGKRATADFTSLIPRVGMSYNISQTSRLSLSYTASVARPTIAQLNPFATNEGYIFGNQGNPDLKPSRIHTIGAQYLKMGNKLITQATINAARETDIIRSNCTANVESGSVLDRYGNFGRENRVAGSLYANYRPAMWLSLTASWSASRHWFRCDEIDLKQQSWSWTLFNLVDLTLPKGWTAGGQYAYVRNAPQLWSTFKDYHLYSLYVNKSCLDGRLTVGVAADAPFQKFRPYEATIHTSTFHSLQHNDLRARSIGVRLTYTLSGGRRVSLRRDQSLVNDDLQTGVR